MLLEIMGGHIRNKQNEDCCMWLSVEMQAVCVCLKHLILILSFILGQLTGQGSNFSDKYHGYMY